MIEDFLAWYQQNEDLLSHLEAHKSLTLTYINDCLVVLRRLAKKENKDLLEDEAIAFDVGFSYLNLRVEALNIYLEKYFANDFHHLLAFDPIISYALYLEDLKDALIEADEFSPVIKAAFNDLEEKIDNALSNKLLINDEIILEVNNTLMRVIPCRKEFLTIPEIFFRLAEELDV